MCTVLLPPGDNPIAVNKYIISYRIISYYYLKQNSTAVSTYQKLVFAHSFLILFFFSTTSRPIPGGSNSLLMCGYWGSSPGRQNDWGVNLTTQLSVVKNQQNCASFSRLCSCYTGQYLSYPLSSENSASNAIFRVACGNARVYQFAVRNPDISVQLEPLVALNCPFRDFNNRHNNRKGLSFITPTLTSNVSCVGPVPANVSCNLSRKNIENLSL